MVSKYRGYSLVDLLIVLTILMLLGGGAMTLVNPAIRYHQAETALVTVNTQLQRARQLAIDERRLYRVTFNTPRTVSVHRMQPAGDTLLAAMDLPTSISFRIESGAPAGTSSPDQMGTSGAIDFGGGNQLIFRPDGAAVTPAGNLANGIVYTAREGDLSSSRAVTVFGATGRIRAWRLVQEGENWVWK